MAHARESSDPKGALDMPDELPVLPLVEAVVFPLTIAPAPVDVTSSRKLVEDAMKGNRLVLLVAMREGDPRRPRAEDLYAYGTAAVVHDAVMGPDAVLRVAVEGLERARIVDWVRSEPYLVARAQRARDLVEHGSDLDVLLRSARQLFLRFVSLVTELSSELAATVNRVTDPRQLVYLLASTTPMTTEARQLILEQPSVVAKLRKTIEHLQHDIAVRELMQSIAGEASAKAATSVTTAEREALLRKQRDTLPRDPLGEHEGDHAAARGLRGQIGRLELPDDARREIERELDRLERTPAASPEHGMIRTYLDWVLKLPWGKASGGAIDVGVARAVLDADHHGLTKVKERIVEYLAVRRLRAERGAECATDVDASREPILCFVGPPGVGKTSLGQSIARALGRKLVRVALGGIHDEAEMRGHRRTYIGAMPGRILQVLARCGAADPVFLLDEIDKLAVGFHGDPGAALLEVLDPAQNHAFVDNYLGVPFDLSRVLFVCTANAVDTIPAPLLDRMELIGVAGYTDAEKIQIARRHLLPKAVSASGLRPAEVQLDDEAVRCIVRGYTREAGVRALGRELAGVMRKVACAVSEGAAVPVRVGAERLRDYLGQPTFQDATAEPFDRPGVAAGLAWLPSGGDILFVEATIIPGDDDRLVLTGMLGSVMRESAQAALSYLRANARRLGVDPQALERKTIHVHVPAGAIPKDGPSAGVTILAALASHATGRVVRSDVGMTGEITLRGRVLPVGGVKEKVLAAHRGGLRAVILPSRCEPQLDDIPREVRDAVRFVFVDSADDALEAAFGAGADGERPTEPVLQGPPASVH